MRPRHPLPSVVAACAFAAACASAVETVAPRPDREEPVDLLPPDPPLLEASTVDDDSGVFAATRPREAGAPDAAPPGDGGAAPICTSYPPDGLRVDELMIASQTGSGDKGEWIELRSYAACTLRLDGVRVRSPRGAGWDEAILAGLLAPGASVVVADTLAPTSNHFLPGPLFPFLASTGIVGADGAPPAATADALKNDGDSVEVVVGARTETFTYPKFANLPRAVSLAFPSDCPAAARPDFANWSQSVATWTPGFRGTPNAPNDDVACP